MPGPVLARMNDTLNILLADASSPTSTNKGQGTTITTALSNQSGITSAAARLTTEDADRINETPLVQPDSVAAESGVTGLTSRTGRRTSSRQRNDASRHAKSNSPGFPNANLYGQRWSPGFPTSTDSRGAEEEALVEDIGKLWSYTQFNAREIRRYSKESSDFRIKLSERLHRYKALLVGSGRSGKWSGFLRDIDIPRATADRYVQRWERSLQPNKGNCLTESISGPTAEEIDKMVARLKPRLKRVLMTKDAVERFLSVLAGSLELP
jgi:hypothetical protein